MLGVLKVAGFTAFWICARVNPELKSLKKALAEVCAEAPYKLTRFQSRFLFSRSDTIYGGTNEIQRNIIAEQALGLPREPRP